MKSVNIILSPVNLKKIQLCYVDSWNPTMQELNNLEKYLQDNKMICVVWLYGDPVEIEDYSSLNSSRITVPFWLGGNLEQAKINYPIIKKHLYPELDDYVKIDYPEAVK